MLVVSNMYPDDRHPSYGVFVRRFVEQSRDAGFSVSLAVMCKSDSTVSKFVRYISFYLSVLFKALFQSFDIVYVHYPSYSFAPIALARRIKRFPCIVNVHGSDVLPVTSKQKRMHHYTALAVKLADRIVAPSEYFSDIVREKYGVEGDRVFVYPSGGIDPEVFHPLPDARVEEVKVELGLDPDLMTVCFAGRITEGKGWDTYLEAVSEVFSQGRRLNVLLVGSGDQDAECAALMKRLGLDGAVVRMSLQPQERLCELYNVADAFAFPGRRSESLGLVAIEAMACGTPVIACDFAAPRYYVRNGYNGWLIPTGDSDALAETIMAMMHNPSCVADLRAGAMETASRYSGTQLIEQLMNIFDR